MSESSAPWNLLTPGDASAAPYDAAEWGLLQSKIIGFGASRADLGIVRGNSATPASNVVFYGLDVRAPGSASVTLKSGTAVVTGTLYENTADLSLSVGANSSGNPRIDSVILRKDYAAQTIRAVIKQGTPAGSPVPPTLTQSAGTTWEIALADIAVANGFATIAQSDILPRDAFANDPDRIVLDRVKNVSGGELVTGDVVISSGGTTGQLEVTTTTTINDYRVAGVWIGRTANNGYGRLLVKGVGLVNIVSSPTGADILVTYSTAKKANLYGGVARHHALGIPLEGTNGGLRWAYVDVRNKGVDYAAFADIKAQNTAGGGFTNGAWRTRDINSGLANATFGDLQFGTIAANKITLPPGMYVIRASAPAYNVDGHQIRLTNNSGPTVIVEGSTEYAPTGVMTRSFAVASVLANAGLTFYVEHRCVTTKATDGFGRQANLTNEIYTMVEVWRYELT